jgi:hypothetical protein
MLPGAAVATSLRGRKSFQGQKRPHYPVMEAYKAYQANVSNAPTHAAALGNGVVVLKAARTGSEVLARILQALHLEEVADDKRLGVISQRIHVSRRCHSTRIAEQEQERLPLDAWWLETSRGRSSTVRPTAAIVGVLCGSPCLC